MATEGGDIVGEVVGSKVAITNPDKVFFPKAGLTKGDVVRYYARGR